MQKQKENEGLILEIYDIEAPAKFGQKLGYKKGCTYQSYLTPLVIRYQAAWNESQLKRPPIQIGLPVGSEVAKSAAKMLDDFEGELSHVQCDFSDFLFFHLGREIIDFDETTKGGVVIIDGGKSAKGWEYLTFEQAFDFFSQKDQMWEDFLVSRLSV